MIQRKIMKRDAAHVLDEYLAASARAGDRSAFDQLVARWQPKLLVHAYRLAGDKELARDVVQESWSDIVRGLYRLDDPATFPAWAFRIVSRRTADALPTHCRRTADALPTQSAVCSGFEKSRRLLQWSQKTRLSRRRQLNIMRMPTPCAGLSLSCRPNTVQQSRFIILKDLQSRK